MHPAGINAILGSRSISVSFQPIVELGEESAPLHAFECVCAGPAGSLVEAPAALLRLARELRIESEVDQAGLAAALVAAPGLVGEPRLHFVAHARTLALSGFTRAFLHALERRRIDPARALLLLIDPDPLDTGALLTARTELHEGGVAIGLDVDRRIYAAPHALVHLSPEVLQLDSTLVRRAARHNLDQALLSSVVRLARSVGARALLRDVETAEERDLAAAHGFTLAHGPLFGEPLTAVAATPDEGEPTLAIA